MRDHKTMAALAIEGIRQAQRGLQLLAEPNDDNAFLAALLQLGLVRDICANLNISVVVDSEQLTGGTDYDDFVRHLSLSETPEVWGYVGVDRAHQVRPMIYDLLFKCRQTLTEFV